MEYPQPSSVTKLKYVHIWKTFVLLNYINSKKFKLKTVLHK